MSRETIEWLNTQTLIGFADKRGQAWHYRASDQGAESNHYDGAIPVEDVRRRLFHWDPIVADNNATYTIVGADGLPQTITVVGKGRQSMVRPAGTFGPDDDGDILGVFKGGYKRHTYGTWLLDNARDIGGDLGIGSAGLLKGGAVAWVQFEMPDAVTTPEGVTFRPFFTAATSFDGSLATTYQTGNQLVVCDNTLAGAMGRGDAAGTRLKVKHSANSIGRLEDARSKIGIVHMLADEFAAEVKTLVETTVTDAQWRAFVDAYVGVPAADATVRTKNSNDRKRGELNQLWNYDARANQWKGSAFGVLQAVTTQSQHMTDVRNISRAERNAQNMVEGKAQAEHIATLDLLNQVLAAV